jgi:hypothetical protein
VITSATGDEEQQTVPTAQHPATVEQPKHALHALTTFELSGYRRELEHAIAYYDTNHPAAPVLADLRSRLGDVHAEQDDRARVSHA